MDLLVDRNYSQKHYMVDVAKGKSDWDFVIPSKIVIYDDELGVKLVSYDNRWTDANIASLSIETSNPLRLKKKADFHSKEPYFMNGEKNYDGICEKLVYIPASKVTITDMGYSLTRSTNEGYEGFPQRVVRHCFVKELNLRIEEDLFHVDLELLKISTKWTDEINSLARCRAIDDMDEIENHMENLRAIKKQYDITRKYYEDFTIEKWYENVSCEDVDENGMVTCKKCGKCYVKDAVWLAPHYCVCKDCQSKATKEELEAVWKQHYNPLAN